MEVNGQFQALTALSWEKSPWSSMEDPRADVDAVANKPARSLITTAYTNATGSFAATLCNEVFASDQFCQCAACVWRFGDCLRHTTEKETISETSDTKYTPTRQIPREDSLIYTSRPSLSYAVPQYYINRNSFNTYADETNCGRRAALGCSNVSTEVRISVIFWPVRVLLQMIYCWQSQYIILERILSNYSHVKSWESGKFRNKIIQIWDLLSLWCIFVG